MTLTLNLTQEEVRELFKEKLVEAFPNYKIKSITYNVDPVYKGYPPVEYKTYEFTGCTIEVEESLPLKEVLPLDSGIKL